MPAAEQLLQEGGALATSSLPDRVKHWHWASGLLFAAAVTMATTAAVHALAVSLWKQLPCTRHRPLPDFLVFPVPELLAANMMVLPLAMAGTLMLMQAGVAVSQAVGALAMALMLAYLAFVAAVLLAVLGRREALGLRYMEHGHSHRQQRGQPVADEQSADGGSSSVPLMYAPHAGGHWARPDIYVANELRRVYQGGCSAGGAMLASQHQGAMGLLSPTSTQTAGGTSIRARCSYAAHFLTTEGCVRPTSANQPQAASAPLLSCSPTC